MTQKDLAVRLDVSRNTIARWEMGAMVIPQTAALAVQFLSQAAPTSPSTRP
jgi:transcriptional regulator with XRE-family HTH domain